MRNYDQMDNDWLGTKAEIALAAAGSHREDLCFQLEGESESRLVAWRGWAERTDKKMR